MEFRFFINEDKCTVAVKAVDPMEEYYREFRDFYKKCRMDCDYSLFENFISAYENQILKMVGVATCNKEAGDVFDVEFGKELAKQRYMKSFEAFRINMYAMMLGKLDSVTGFAAKRLQFCCNRRMDRENRIADMTVRIE